MGRDRGTNIHGKSHLQSLCISVKGPIHTTRTRSLEKNMLHFKVLNVICQCSEHQERNLKKGLNKNVIELHYGNVGSNISGA